MKIITFTDKNMTISAEKLVKSAQQKVPGCTTKIFRETDFSLEFLTTNQEILKQPRGAGYWLYKSYFILQTLHTLNDGEVMMYCDAGLIFEQNINLLLAQMDQDIYVFGNKYKHGDWCKMDCLNAMHANTQHYLHHEQVQASVIMIKKTQASVNFMKEWLLWGQMPNMIDDSPSIATNYDNFIEHRHDQAILTNLVIRHGYKLHWWPVQYMLRHHHKHPNDNNQVVWQHHRFRNNQW